MNSRPIRLTTSTLRPPSSRCSRQPAPGVPGGKFAGRRTPRVAVDVGDELALVPDVIAGRQDVDAAIVELAAKALGQAKAAGRVLGIDDDEIEREIAAQLRHVLS